jgi:SAM-dependent methyltransferase
MGYSSEWDDKYKDNTHLSVWPWSDVVSLTMRNCKSNFSKDFNVLELGCGAGANIPFFSTNDLNYHALEGSEFIVDKLHKSYPELSENIVVGDFTVAIPFQKEFDMILDRASITCNSESSIRNTMNLVKKSLKPGGKFIAVDWYSTENSEFNIGDQIDDEYTRIFKNKGEFNNTGRVHFFNKVHLLSFFEGFKVTTLAHKSSEYHIPERDGYQFSSWNIVAEKL